MTAATDPDALQSRRSIAVGEAPSFESQRCRTTGKPRYTCDCRKCRRAYYCHLTQLVADNIAELTRLRRQARINDALPATDALVLDRLQVCPVPDFARPLNETLEIAEAKR